MNWLTEWIFQNKEWIFSGIGVAVLTGVIALLIRRRSKHPLKGLANFLYVATNWSTISRDFEQYRRQIEDRDRWLKTNEETLRRIYQLEIQKIHTEADDRAKTLEEQLKFWRYHAIETYEALWYACLALAIEAQQNPGLWELHKPNQKPLVRDLVERIKTKLTPLQSQPPLLGDLLATGGVPPGPPRLPKDFGKK